MRVNIASANLNELLKDLKNELDNKSNLITIKKVNLNNSKSGCRIERQPSRTGNDIPNLTFDNKVMKRVNKAKYLGIIIDDNLNCKGQYKSKVKLA